MKNANNTQKNQVVDYYSRLGVPVDASLVDIKRSYRKLLKRYHPDMLPFDDPAERRKAELATQQIIAAYAILSDSEKRRIYDEYFQASFVAQIKGDVFMGTDTKHNTSPFSKCSKLMHQFRADQPETNRQRQFMSVYRKTMLIPIPFCIAAMISSAFWNLGQMTGAMFLGGLTAVLSYPLILAFMILRLIFPISHVPLLNIKQKLVCTPIILGSAAIIGWIWFIVVDQSGTLHSPWDLCWWCSLISITCAILAYL
jgi:DnaJ domain